MFPPVFEVVSADSDVQSNLGSSPCRFYPFGEAPQNVTSPYGVWGVVTGTPENYVNQVPDLDTWVVQIEVFAKTASAARDAAEAVRNVIEPLAHIVAWRGESRDAETRLYRYSFDVDWMVSRETQS